MNDYDFVAAVLVREIACAKRLKEAQEAAAALCQIREWQAAAEAEDKHLFPDASVSGTNQGNGA